MFKGYTKFQPKPLCSVEDDTSGLTDSCPFYVERVHFHIIHFTQVALKIMLPLVKWRIEFKDGIILFEFSTYSWVLLVTALRRFGPKFVSQFQTRHVFLQHRFSIKTYGALIKSFVLLPFYRQNKLTFVNDWCGLVENTHYVAQYRHVIRFSFSNIR